MNKPITYLKFISIIITISIVLAYAFFSRQLTSFVSHIPDGSYKILEIYCPNEEKKILSQHNIDIDDLFSAYSLNLEFDNMIKRELKINKTVGTILIETTDCSTRAKFKIKKNIESSLYLDLSQTSITKQKGCFFRKKINNKIYQTNENGDISESSEFLSGYWVREEEANILWRTKKKGKHFILELNYTNEEDFEDMPCDKSKLIAWKLERAVPNDPHISY